MKLNKITATVCAVAVAAGAAGAFPTFGDNTLPDISITASAAEIIETGIINSDLKWRFDSEGTLTISRTTTAGSEVEMPDFEKSNDIPWTAFRDQIKKVIFGKGITYIGKGALIECSNLTSIEFPDELYCIGMVAFFNCTSLKSVTFPDGLRLIGDGAFYGCAALEEINAPDNIYRTGDSVFTGTKWFNDQKQENSMVKLNYILLDGTGSEYPNGVCELPIDVFGICDFAFEGESDIKTLKFGEFTINVERCAFRDCSSLTEVKLNEMLVRLGVGAFYNCKNLKSIRVPASVKQIDNMALGYYSVNDTEQKLPGFTIYGAKDSAAEKYASENGFTFIPNAGSGDLNTDGVVDVDDLMLMQKLVAGWKVSVNKYNADIDGQEGIGVDDLLLLQKKVAGWNVTLSYK